MTYTDPAEFKPLSLAEAREAQAFLSGMASDGSCVSTSSFMLPAADCARLAEIARRLAPPPLSLSEKLDRAIAQILSERGGTPIGLAPLQLLRLRVAVLKVIAEDLGSSNPRSRLEDVTRYLREQQ